MASHGAAAQRGSHSGFYAPRVALFCPVKGLEPGLDQNLAALTSFDYSNYEIFFAMASGEDPARKDCSINLKRRASTLCTL